MRTGTDRAPPLPINVGAINGRSGCIDAWNTNLWSATTTNQPLKWCHNYHPFLPGIGHSKTKRPSVLARNRPIFIILYYYTTATLHAPRCTRKWGEG